MINFFELSFIATLTSPLEQFDIKDLLTLHVALFGNLAISITNIGLYLSTGAYLILMINLLPDFSKVASNK